MQHMLIPREIGNRLPLRHDLLRALDVKFAVVQNEIALRVEVVKNRLIGFHFQV